MNQFEFTSKLRTTLFVMMAVGIVCLGITFVMDDALHTRFWSNVLHNSVFFAGIALLALFFYSANIVALSGWYVQFKRIWEAQYAFLLPGLILMLLIGVASMGGIHHLYHWADPESVEADTILKGKSSFLNFKWYLGGTVIFGGIWYFVSTRMRALSKAEDTHGTINFKYHKKMRIWAAFMLPFIGFTSAAMVWLWIMSVDAHWYSTLYAWYCGVSWLVSMLCLTVLMLYYLKSKGYFAGTNVEHIHDLGKYIFAFSVFWAYLWFSQYMLIWYANVGEETIYFNTRRDEYPALFAINVVINFVLPFFILMRNDTKRKTGTMILVAILLFFGHWLDFFLMIKPGVLHTAHELAGHGAEAHGAELHGAAEHASHFMMGFTLPGLLEIGTMIGFLGFFLYWTYAALTKANLVPRKDPYLQESIHHHVI
jgi:hypothetical protein